MNTPRPIFIHTDYITLGQLLKLAQLIQSGGEAKEFLKNNTVAVNGETDQRRGRKLFPGNTVTILGAEYLIEHDR